VRIVPSRCWGVGGKGVFHGRTTPNPQEQESCRVRIAKEVGRITGVAFLKKIR